jgi:hypothetical protein
MVRMNDDGHGRTETCSEDLLIGLLRRHEDGHLRNETGSEHLLS